MWNRHISHLQQFLNDSNYNDEAQRLDIPQRLVTTKVKLAAVQQDDYVEFLTGTLGADPLSAAHVQVEETPVVVWDKASLSKRLASSGNARADEALQAYEMPTLLERVKSKFKRARLN